MTYAMILLNNVIGILESDTPPSWPPDPQGNPVTAVECDDTVELGMVYNPETGEFSEYVPAPYIPTQADRIEALLNQRITETQEQAVDAYTEKLIEEGTL